MGTLSIVSHCFDFVARRGVLVIQKHDEGYLSFVTVQIPVDAPSGATLDEISQLVLLHARAFLRSAADAPAPKQPAPVRAA